MDTLNILLTGAGAPGTAGTVFALKNNPESRPVRIVGVDRKQVVAGAGFVDRLHVVPGPDDPAYFACLQDICRREEIDLIVPQTTKEIVYYSLNKQRFADAGIAVMVCAGDGVSRLNDKWNLINLFRELDLPAPLAWLVGSKSELLAAADRLGYPARKIVAKIPCSNGMRGLRILSGSNINEHDFLNNKPDSAECTLEYFMRIFENDSLPDLIVSEFLPGDEYSVDVFRGGENFVAIPRLRVEIRSGISFVNRIELREDMQRTCRVVADRLDMSGVFGFQFKLSDKGVPVILECNPRIQGTMVASMAAGANIIWAGVNWELGRQVRLPEHLADGGTFLRYWGGVWLDSANEVAGVV